MKETKATVIRLPKKLHEKCRKLALERETSLNKLVIHGLEIVLNMNGVKR